MIHTHRKELRQNTCYNALLLHMLGVCYGILFLFYYSVSEDLDDILQTAVVATDVTCVPGLNDPSGDGNLDVGGSANENVENVAFADMQRDDILTYIEDNTEQDSDFDLF